MSQKKTTTSFPKSIVDRAKKAHTSEDILLFDIFGVFAVNSSFRRPPSCKPKTGFLRTLPLTLQSLYRPDFLRPWGKLVWYEPYHGSRTFGSGTSASLQISFFSRAGDDEGLERRVSDGAFLGAVRHSLPPEVGYAWGKGEVLLATFLANFQPRRGIHLVVVHSARYNSPMD